MSDFGKAVFLSYASQDAEAARRICDALRAAGVEVWFDQSELVGGDAWDQKIRKQIKECALLIPIISQNTQARHEGYFRLEWRLADQRTHLMGRAKAFLLPVTIDGTSDADADVPDSFVAVQWTKAPGGEVSPAFVARVKRLVDGGTSPDDARERREAGRLRPASERGSSFAEATADKERTPLPPGRSSRWLKPVLGTAGLVILALAITFWRQAHGTASGNPIASMPPAAPATAEPLAKAWALMEDDPLMTRANVELAEQIAREVLAKDPTNPEANAVAAWANFQFLLQNYDDSPRRLADLKQYADKAHLLAPDSLHAELALCGELVSAHEYDEALRRLQALAGREPGNLTVLRTWAWVSTWHRGPAGGKDGATDDPVFARLREASPLGRAYADTFAAGLRWAQGDYAGADRLLDEVFAAGQPVRLTYLVRLLVLTYGWGDLPAAQGFARTIPAKLLLEDVFITHVSQLWLFSGDYDQALATLARTPREFLHEALIATPTAGVRGDALAAAGRHDLAVIQWNEALKLVNRRLEGEPDNGDLREAKGNLLAQLGDLAGARKEFALVEEMRHATPGNLTWGRDYGFANALGDHDEAIARLDRALARDNPRWPGAYNDLRYNPALAPLRTDPRVRPLLERGTAWLAAMHAGRAVEDAPAAMDASVPDKSVAVLAFANLSDDKANEYFSDGISEELLNVLAKVPGLKVTARTSSFFFKGKDVPVPEIARQLGVAYVIEGSVRKQGDRVRITAQLIKAADGFQVWSDTFTRELKDIFAVQDEIAGLVARNLSLTLGVSSGTASVNPEAFELYVQARQAWNLRNEQGFARAEQLLERVLEITPNLARAHAALADVWYFQTVSQGVTGTFSRPEPPAFARVRAKIQEALALDPDSAEAHASLGNVLFSTWKFAEAEREYRRAIALNPNYASAHQWLAAVLTNDGRLDEALAECRRASELDPLSSRIADNLGYVLYVAGRYTEALARYDRAIALQPSNLQAVSFKPLMLAALGRFDEALPLAQALPPSLPTRASVLLSIYARAGRLHEAEAVYPAALASGAVPKCFLLLQLGRKAEAVAALDASAVDNPGNYLLAEYDQLDDDPAFRKFIAALGWTEARARIQAWRAAHPAEKPAPNGG